MYLAHGVHLCGGSIRPGNNLLIDPLCIHAWCVTPMWYGSEFYLWVFLSLWPASSTASETACYNGAGIYLWLSFFVVCFRLDWRRTFALNKGYCISSDSSDNYSFVFLLYYHNGSRSYCTVTTIYTVLNWCRTGARLPWSSFASAISNSLSDQLT